LVKACIKENKCEICGISEWNGKPIQMELHHIDGDRTNHKLSNLMMLCPNCHSQTETFRAKNIKM
jgi:5-methylcytosine-specific restriction endonuclease McrA